MTHSLVLPDRRRAGRTLVRTTLLAGLSAALVPAQALPTDAGTQVAAVPVQIAYDSGSQTGVTLEQAFPGFVVDRLLEVFMQRNIAEGMMPGDTFTANLYVGTGFGNDTISFRVDLTDATLALENVSLTYDDASGFPDLVVGGPVSIGISPYGTDISGAPAGLSTIDLPPGHALHFVMEATMPASATIGDVVTQKFWSEPLIAATSLSGTPNPEAYSLLNVTPVANTLDGIETEYVLDFTPVASDAVTGAAAIEAIYKVAVPEVAQQGGQALSADVPAAECGTKAALDLVSSQTSDLLPGTCRVVVTSFANWGFSPTDNFAFSMPIPDAGEVVAVNVNSDFSTAGRTGLVDGPEPGTGPVILVEDAGGNPCTAQSTGCTLRIEDASLLPQEWTDIEVRYVIK